MSCYRFVPGVALGLLVWASSASAILIESRGVVVGGYLLRTSDDGKRVTIRTYTLEGQPKDEEYARDKIKILHELDVKRLAALSKDNPRAYCEYADELTRPDLKADLEAKDTARRLYLIAASLDPQKLGVRSLLKMSDLAPTPVESRKCRALAYLLDSKADAKLLARDEDKPEKPLKAQPEALRDFTKALHAYRAGKVKLAIETAKRKGVDTIFSMAPGKMDQKSFLQMCADATGRGAHQDLPDDTLRVLLRAELWATEQLLGEPVSDKKQLADNKWSSALQKQQRSPVLPLSLETITEFKPSRCHYRDGNWVVPSD
jgi:hypothetical protein